MQPFVIYFVFVIHLNLDSKDPQGAGAGCKGQRWNVIVTPQNVIIEIICACPVKKSFNGTELFCFFILFTH